MYTQNMLLCNILYDIYKLSLYIYGHVYTNSSTDMFKALGQHLEGFWRRDGDNSNGGDAPAPVTATATTGSSTIAIGSEEENNEKDRKEEELREIDRK